MSIREPQRDLPAGLRGGADAWDVPQASVILADEFFESAGPVEVAATFSGSWAVRRYESADFGGSWAVRRFESGDFSDAWTVRRYQDGPTAGYILVDGEPLLVDGEPVWYEDANVFRGSWVVEQGVSYATGQFVGAWSVRNFAQASYAGAFAVRGYAGTTFAGGWTVRQFASGQLDGVWAVGGVVGGAFSGSWAVRNFAQSSFSGGWSVRSFAHGEHAGQWTVRGFSHGSLSGSWAVDGVDPPLPAAVPPRQFGGLAAGPDAVIPRDEFLRRFGSQPGATPSARRDSARARRRREEALLLGP